MGIFLGLSRNVATDCKVVGTSISGIGHGDFVEYLPNVPRCAMPRAVINGFPLYGLAVDGPVTGATYRRGRLVMRENGD